MTRGIAWQHSWRSPSPDEASFRKSNLVARPEPHVNHLIAEPVIGMYRVARVREQDKTLYAPAVVDRAIAFHHVAKSADHRAGRDPASVQRAFGAFEFRPSQDSILIRARDDRGEIKRCGGNPTSRNRQTSTASPAEPGGLSSD